MIKKTQWIVIIGIIALLLFVGGKKVAEYISEPPTPKNEWQEQYRQELINNNIDLKYTQAQSTIDYVTPDLQDVISKMDSKSPEDAIKKATRLVLNKIKYASSEITPEFCYAETATSTYRLGFGDCVSMTKLGMAILRGQGLAVRSVGGCVKWSNSCMPIMGVVPLQIQKAEIYDGKKRGYLHEWSEVWLPDKGWITVDFTNGAIYTKGCKDYIFYSYDEAQYKDMCVITDNKFIQQCKGDFQDLLIWIPVSNLLCQQDSDCKGKSVSKPDMICREYNNMKVCHFKND